MAVPMAVASEHMAFHRLPYLMLASIVWAIGAAWHGSPAAICLLTVLWLDTIAPPGQVCHAFLPYIGLTSAFNGRWACALLLPH